MNTSLTVYTDGGSRNNPGEAAYGFVIYENEKQIYKEGKRIGIATNNIAEYTAILAAFEWTKKNKNGLEKIYVFADSQLAISQLTGIYKIKNKNLLPLIQKIKIIEKQIAHTVIYSHIRREKNKVADALVNQALDTGSA